MKYLTTTLALLMALLAESQTIKEGDNLKTEFGKIKNPYFFKAPKFTEWAEGDKMLLIGAKSNPMDCEFLFVALKDTTLIGVFVVKEPSAFIIDMEGNSILIGTSEFFFLPPWVVKNKTKVISSDVSILSLLDKMYEKTLQANELELDEETITNYQRYQKDTTLANRHIALLVDNYQNLITETATKGVNPPAKICISVMETLSAECLSLYKTVPAIACIYLGESLQTAGMTDRAQEHFENSLKLHPASIPLLVYNYRLEQDPVKQKEQLVKLKREYANHWMVKVYSKMSWDDSEIKKIIRLYSLCCSASFSDLSLICRS